MRALAAALLSTVLLLSAAGSHVHERAQAAPGSHGTERCAVCLARGAEVANDATPELAPPTRVVGAVAAEPGAAPVTGAPLGAIPGQSPPVA